jgi:hypothetical protein
MKCRAPDLIHILLSTGKITETDYDNNRGTPKLKEENYEVRDELVLCRHRCVIITHNETVEYAEKLPDAKKLKLQSLLTLIRKHEKVVETKKAKEAEKLMQQNKTPERKAEEKDTTADTTNNIIVI